MSLENESDTKKEIIITDVEKICEKSSGETRSSLKIQILKRLGVLIIYEYLQIHVSDIMVLNQVLKL